MSGRGNQHLPRAVSRQDDGVVAQVGRGRTVKRYLPVGARRLQRTKSTCVVVRVQSSHGLPPNPAHKVARDFPIYPPWHRCLDDSQPPARSCNGPGRAGARHHRARAMDSPVVNETFVTRRPPPLVEESIPDRGGATLKFADTCVLISNSATPVSHPRCRPSYFLKQARRDRALRSGQGGRKRWQPQARRQNEREHDGRSSSPVGQPDKRVGIRVQGHSGTSDLGEPHTELNRRDQRLVQLWNRRSARCSTNGPTDREASRKPGQSGSTPNAE